MDVGLVLLAFFACILVCFVLLLFASAAVLLEGKKSGRHQQ